MIIDFARDYRKPGPEKIKRVLGSEQAPSTDAEYKEAIHKLYAEPGPGHMNTDDVDKILQNRADDLPGALMTALYAVRGRSRQCVTKITSCQIFIASCAPSFNQHKY